MNGVEKLLVIIVFVALVVFSIRAFMHYGSYKGSIYSYIYDNYLIDYYYRLNVFRDVSKSARLKKVLGYHRIVYSTMSDKQGNIVTRFMTVIFSKGLATVAYYHPEGKIEGDSTKPWVINRTDENGNIKRYKIDNGDVHLREYIGHIKELTQVDNVEKIIAIADGYDHSKLRLATTIVDYSKLVDTLKEADCGYGLSQIEIDDIYNKLSGKKENKK